MYIIYEIINILYVTMYVYYISVLQTIMIIILCSINKLIKHMILIDIYYTKYNIIIIYIMLMNIYNNIKVNQL